MLNYIFVPWKFAVPDLFCYLIASLHRIKVGECSVAFHACSCHFHILQPDTHPSLFKSRMVAPPGWAYGELHAIWLLDLFKRTILGAASEIMSMITNAISNYDSKAFSTSVWIHVTATNIVFKMSQYILFKFAYCHFTPSSSLIKIKKMVSPASSILLWTRRLQLDFHNGLGNTMDSLEHKYI